MSEEKYGIRSSDVRAVLNSGISFVLENIPILTFTSDDVILMSVSIYHDNITTAFVSFKSLYFSTKEGKPKRQTISTAHFLKLLDRANGDIKAALMDMAETVFAEYCGENIPF